MSFHTRRLELPNGKGWIEIRGEFNLFDLDDDQRRLLAMMADWFAEFERTYSDERTTPPDPQTASIQTKEG
jgi:DNA invertase Pin-like site-specific DNA recombinase